MLLPTDLTLSDIVIYLHLFTRKQHRKKIMKCMRAGKNNILVNFGSYQNIIQSSINKCVDLQRECCSQKSQHRFNFSFFVSVPVSVLRTSADLEVVFLSSSKNDDDDDDDCVSETTVNLVDPWVFLLNAKKSVWNTSVQCILVQASNMLD